MARRVLVTLIDDLDGTSKADETVRFALDDYNYEIDLRADNAAALRAALDQFVRCGRRVRTVPASPVRAGQPAGGRTTQGNARPRRLGDRRAKIAEFARQFGQHLADRGRVPVALEQQFDAWLAAGMPDEWELPGRDGAARETAAILADPATMGAIREAEAEVAADGAVTVPTSVTVPAQVPGVVWQAPPGVAAAG